jgi:thymidylate synthase ThyX
MYNARILADSISANGDRLTTFEITFPRFVLAELNTHRMLSKNSASSRAIPTHKQIERVMNDPAMPVEWGRDQAGMKARQLLDQEEEDLARQAWLRARDCAVEQVQALQAIGPVDENGKQGVHKQIINRLLEPFLWQTVLITGTDWGNFFALRCHADAQPEIREIALMMQDLYNANSPVQLGEGEWHLPLVYDEDRALARQLYGDQANEMLLKVSTGRCARVSYLTHDGKRDLDKDVFLHDILLDSGHMSPFEHVARPMNSTELAQIRAHQIEVDDDTTSTGEEVGAPWFSRQMSYAGNFRGWIQYRKTLRLEWDYGLAQQEAEAL